MALKCLPMLIAVACIVGCSRSETAPAEAPQPVTLSVTRWSAKTELFAEYPPLVAGATARFAIHLTRMDSFKPVGEGTVEVHLREGRAPADVFRVDKPSRPGIFGVDVKPSRAGKRELVIVLRSGAVQDEHYVGSLEIYSNTQAALAAETNDGTESPGISFLKEQQWTLDFETDVVRQAAVRESIRVPAQIAPRPDGSADVVAPIAGRLTSVADAAVGRSVSRGQELARLLPPPADPSELPQLEQARIESSVALELATRDRERAERLVTAGAAPQKRLDEARATEAQAKARAAAAESRLGQYNTARTAGAGEPQGAFIMRAPVAGVVARRDATSGANVAAGDVLFHVVDAVQVHVVGQIPEADAERARQARAAEIEIPGRDERLPAGRLASVGRVLDPETRTLPIIFALDNRNFALTVGQTVFLHLLFDATAPRPALPVSSVVDDAGRPIVFVQRSGETFERRAVTLGPRSGGTVQVVDGVTGGERVVTKGAYLVRLASLSTQVPAHGHVH